MVTVEPPQRAVASGGPLDGRLLPALDAGPPPQEYDAAMADGTVHVYRRTDAVDPNTPGGPAVVFAWAGRKP